MDIVGILRDTNTTLVLIIFVLFVFSLKRIMGILVNAMWVILGSVLFPIFASKVLGLNVPVDGDSIIFFATFGLGVYALYILGTAIYKVLGIFEKGGSEIVKPIKKGFEHRRDKMEKRAYDFVEEKKKKKED